MQTLQNIPAWKNINQSLIQAKSWKKSFSRNWVDVDTNLKLQWKFKFPTFMELSERFWFDEINSWIFDAF